MRSLAAYRDILKKKGLRYSVHEAWKKIQRFHFLRDDRLLELQWECKAYRKLKKYAYVLDRPVSHTAVVLNPYPDKIWVCWLQGEDQAPPLVRKCLASVRKYSGGREVILLTEENIPRYVTFPEYILKKRARHVISNTHFSDLLRVALLARYGGIWMDATVLLTDFLPDVILHAPLFCFQTSRLSPAPSRISSWLIAARPGNETVVRTLELLEEYWKRENFLCHYYLFHLFFTFCINSRPRLSQEWDKVPYFNNVAPHELSFELFHPYSEERWRQIRAFSPVHKLTWKFKSVGGGTKGTFLEKILES